MLAVLIFKDLIFFLRRRFASETCAIFLPALFRAKLRTNTRKMNRLFTFTLGVFLVGASASFACPRADVELILTQHGVVTKQVEYFREQSAFTAKFVQETIESVEGSILDQQKFDAFFSVRMADFVSKRGTELFSEALCTGMSAEEVETLANFYRSDYGKLWLQHDENPALLKRFYVWLISGAWRHSEYAYLGTTEYFDAYSALLDEQFEVSERLFDSAEIAVVIRRKDIVGFANEAFRETRARNFEALSNY